MKLEVLTEREVFNQNFYGFASVESDYGENVCQMSELISYVLEMCKYSYLFHGLLFRESISITVIITG